MANARAAIGDVGGRKAAALLFVSWLAVAAEAHAAPAPIAPIARTILLIGPRDDPASTRMAAELGALGFEVKTAKGTPRVGTDSEIEIASQSASAIATIAVDFDHGEVHVWTVDRVSGRIQLRAVVALEQDPAVVALRTVEALRTSLNEVDEPPPPRAAAPSSPTPRVAEQFTVAIERPPASLGLSIGPALSVSAAHFGFSWHGLVQLHWLWSRSWGIEVMGVAPITDERRSEAEGSASLTFGFIAAGAHWRPILMQGWLVDFGTGIGAGLIHAEGLPNAGYSGEKSDRALALPFARVGCAVSVVSPLWIRADLAAAIALPRPVFQFADHTVGPWGQPLVIGSIGVEVAMQ